MKKNEPIRVAVYGTLLTGEGNYGVGADALDRTPCFLRGILYDPHYGFPAFVPKNRGPFAVTGEVLTVTPETFAQLDRLEGYPHLYDRKRVPVLLMNGRTLRAWVYVMVRLPADATEIRRGDWRAYRRNTLGRSAR